MRNAREKMESNEDFEEKSSEEDQPEEVAKTKQIKKKSMKPVTRVKRNFQGLISGHAEEEINEHLDADSYEEN